MECSQGSTLGTRPQGCGELHIKCLHGFSTRRRATCSSDLRSRPACWLVRFPVRLLAGRGAVLRHAAGRTRQHGECVFGRSRQVAALRRPAADAGHRRAMVVQCRSRHNGPGHDTDARHHSLCQAPNLTVAAMLHLTSPWRKGMRMTLLHGSCERGKWSPNSALPMWCVAAVRRIYTQASSACQEGHLSRQKTKAACRSSTENGQDEKRHLMSTT